MSILINSSTRVIVQGITGSQGRFHTDLMQKYGTQIAAGVTPGKGGSDMNGIPVCDTVREAVEKYQANASVIFVPPKAAAASILEAIDAELDLVVCITEGIPVLDMVRVKDHLRGRKTRLIGPNCPGLITPDECKIGILPGSICRRGHIGVVSRSGTLTYEAIRQITNLGLGQSTAVGIGGDPVKGLNFTDILEMFEADEETEAVVMIGEIGGSGEELAADYIRGKFHKPAAAFISGATAPAGKRMGHAGAIISGGKGTAEGKKAALRAAGVTVAETPDRIGEALLEALKQGGLTCPG